MILKQTLMISWKTIMFLFPLSSPHLTIEHFSDLLMLGDRALDSYFSHFGFHPQYYLHDFFREQLLTEDCSNIQHYAEY
jgi:hypothetical protein